MGTGRFEPQRSAGCSLALLIGLLWGANAARAAEPVVAAMSERGTGPGDGCVDAEVIARDTSALIGRPVFGEVGQAHVQVTVRVDGPTRATILLHDPEQRPLGQRTLTADSCSELTEALSLALSLMLDFTTDDVERLREEEAQRQTESSAPTAESTPGSPAADLRAPSAPAEPSTPPETPAAPGGRARPEGRGLLSAEGRTGLGFAPGPLFAAGLSASLDAPPLPLLRLDAAYWFPREFSREGGTLEVSSWETGLAVAPAVIRWGRARAFAGAHGAAGSTGLAGRDYPESLRGRSLFVRAGVLGLLEFDFEPLVAHVSVQLDTPLWGYRAMIDTAAGARQQFRVSPLLFSSTAGVGVRVW